jgi:hypothetical protein
VKTSNGWNAAYAHGNEYPEFRVIGNGAKLQDAYHVLLQKGVGMTVSFVDKKELQNDGSREPEAAFLLTLKFDDAGNWKIVKTHQMSKKELEDEQEIVYHFRRDRRVHDSLLFLK